MPNHRSIRKIATHQIDSSKWIIARLKQIDLDISPNRLLHRVIIGVVLHILQWERLKRHSRISNRYAFQIVLQTREILMALPSLVDVKVPNGKHFTVCGDVHGQGSFSVEVILTLFAFKCMSPSGC